MTKLERQNVMLYTMTKLERVRLGKIELIISVYPHKSLVLIFGTTSIHLLLDLNCLFVLYFVIISQTLLEVNEDNRAQVLCAHFYQTTVSSELHGM